MVKFRMNTPQQAGWLTRIVFTLVTLVLVVLGFFFLTVALIAGALVAAVVGARLWWGLRKLKRAQGSVVTEAASTVVEGNYTVIERESTVVNLPPKQQP
jgi:protein-S-isoprenylcysteine O-methyltransferase Ste14